MHKQTVESPESLFAGVFPQGSSPARVAMVVFAITGTVSAVLFGMIYDFEITTDLPAHVHLLLQSKASGDNLGYTIYYALLDVLSGGTGDERKLRLATIAILAVSVGLRCALVGLLVLAARGAEWVSVLVGIAIAFVMPLAIPGDKLYLGKFAPTIWHNSTTILAMPLCLVALIAVSCYLRVDRVPAWSHIGIVALLLGSAAAKPNYLLAFVPAVAVWVAIRGIMRLRIRGVPVFGPQLPRIIVIGATGVAVLAFMYLSTFGGQGLTIGGLKVGFGIRPMIVWGSFVSSPAWSLVASILLPAVATLAVFRRGVRLLEVQLAWLTMSVAVLEFMVMAEVLSDGSVLMHGNWMWGAQISVFVLYAVTVATLVKFWSEASWLKWVTVALGAVQLLLGFIFIWQVAVMGILPTKAILG